ncbi:MAG: hypothetical protein ACFFDT_06330, partial [Candidatus Hodarchaeota archaeon]
DNFPPRVLRLAKRMNLEPHQVKNRLSELYWDEELDKTAIAKKYDIPHTTLGNIWKDLGIPSCNFPPSVLRLANRMNLEPHQVKDKLFQLHWDEELDKKAIAKKYNFPYGTLWDICKNLGIPSRRHGLLDNFLPRVLRLANRMNLEPHQVKDKLLQLHWDKGLSKAAIAKKYDIPRSTLGNIWNDLSIPSCNFRPSVLSHPDYWRPWQDFCETLAKLIYSDMQVLTQYMGIEAIRPDIVIKDSKGNIVLIIEAKMNGLLSSVKTDTESYARHCPRLEFWCFENLPEDFDFKTITEIPVDCFLPHHLLMRIKNEQTRKIMTEAFQQLQLENQRFIDNVSEFQGLGTGDW